MIETRELEFRYPDGTRALKGVDIAIKRGTKVAFVGPNGSGKSTLFLHLNGVLKPTKGEVLFEGRPIRYDKPSLTELRQKIGIVLQDADDQLFAPSVWQDVAFGPKNLGLPDEEVRGRVERALKVVGIEDLAKKPPHFLSHGQKKRVAIAGVLAMEPEVLILDEPTSDLDPEGSDEVMDMLEELSHLGKTVVVSTHSVEFAYSWADYVYIMVSGTVKAHGRPKEIFSNSPLLRGAKLTCPKVVEFYNELRESNSIMPGGTPKNLLELISQTAVYFSKFAEVPDGVKENEYVSLVYDNGRLKVGKPGEERKGGWTGRIVKICDNHLAAVVILERRTEDLGNIFIYRDEDFRRADFFKHVDAHRIDFIGALGTKAKLIAREEGITLDFESDVVHKALFKAIAGKNTLIIASESMVEHARSHIEDFALESGLRIRTETLVN